MFTSKNIIITLLISFVRLNSLAQSNLEILQATYQHKSILELNHFFELWQKEIPTIDNTELSALNDTVRQAYNVFNTFYQPLHIDAIGGSEFGNKIYDNVKYFILQNSLDVALTDKIYYSEVEIDSAVVSEINKIGFKDSTRNAMLKRTNGKLSNSIISEFRPDKFYIRNLSSRNKETVVYKVKNFRPFIMDKPALYLNKKYDTILNAFLGNNHLALGAGGIMNPARSKGESAKRQKFLENFVKIWYGHWGGYWQLYSYPAVATITFDKELKYARINYRMIYEGGEAILKKDEKGNWVLLSANRTWIE